MTIQDNKAIATTLLEALALGDIGRAETLLHDDATWWVLGFGTFDRATLLAATTAATGGATAREYKVTGITAEGSRVAVEAEGAFTFPDRTYQNRYHIVVIVEDGKVRSGREYCDPRAVQP